MTRLRHYCHVSLLPDGNGRWALERGLPRAVGYEVGASNFLRLLPDLAQLPVDILSVYLFSTENWGRPPAEVAHILQVIERGVTDGLPVFQANNVRLCHIGELAGLPPSLQNALLTTVKATQNNDGLLIVGAINYGGRREIIRVAQRLLSDNTPVEAVDEQLVQQNLYMSDLPDPEIILRTGGNQRLSNWMTWQTVGAMLRPIPVLWPELRIENLFTELWAMA